jgi:hypothetical protein
MASPFATCARSARGSPIFTKTPDAERECAYDRDLKVGRLDKALELPRARWTIVDMAADWNIVFPLQRETVGT